MQTVTAAHLLTIWERGIDANAVQRALLLLSAVDPDAPPESLAELSIGQRDMRLLRLRERLFGGRLNGVAACPTCGQTLDLDFSVGDLLPDEARLSEESGLPPGGVWTASGRSLDQFQIEVEGCAVVFRLPNSLDLAALTALPDMQQAHELLLRRCVLSVLHDGIEMDAGALSETAQGAVAQAMAEADPGADIQLEVGCPNCGTRWLTTFDIAGFLWRELHAWALRTLRDVHMLASAYGWSEAEILALSARRRQWYIDMVTP
jgi:hypothetical protein